VLAGFARRSGVQGCMPPRRALPAEQVTGEQASSVQKAQTSREPTTGLPCATRHPLTSDFRLRTSEFRLPTSDLRPLASADAEPKLLLRLRRDTLPPANEGRGACISSEAGRILW
jgi:hypothetical protein